MTTPLMKQYEALKASVPGAILLYRLGDFYEMFNEDARVASAALGITLTARAKDGDRIPMAGFPHHASLPYVRKLLAAGHRVAVCEQVEDPAAARGVVRREVVRVYSPGTLLEDGLLEQGRANHILAIAQGDGRLGVAWTDLSTGHFWADEIDEGGLEDLVARLEPSEALVPEGDDPAWIGSLRRAGAVVTRPAADGFDGEGASRRLREHFAVGALDAFGLGDLPDGVRAAGALLGYACDTQRGAVGHLHPPRRPACEGRMEIDRATLRGLEVLRPARGEGASGTLLGAIDATRTAGGARLLREWLTRPLTDAGALRARHDAVAWLARETPVRERIRALLGEVYDLERIAGRLGTGRANPRDLLGLATSRRAAIAVASAVDEGAPEALRGVAARIPADISMESAIERTLRAEPPATHVEGGVIADGVDPRIDELRTLLADGDAWVGRFRDEEARRTGIPSLRVGYHRVFGYGIEVTHTHRARVPDEYVRVQTMKNAERFTTPALKEQEERILTARERLRRLEIERFEALRDEAAAGVRGVQASAAAVAEIDVLAGFAHLGVARGYARPEIVDEPLFQASQARHPVLDVSMGGAFVPNDLDLSAGRWLQVVTGPNMAGKSTFIRQAGLLALMAQAGCFVPAASMRLGCVDRVFARIGAADDLSRGQSTFLVEMAETALLLRHATPRSLVILDEIGRGTSTYDGLSIARAVAEDLALRVRCRALFATHYHELTALAGEAPGVVNLNVEVREWQGEVVFLHRIVDGAADRSYGIHVARLAGLPARVVHRARAILAQLEASAPAGGGRDPFQLPLFDGAPQAPEPAAPDPLRERLAGMDPERLTPLQALQALDALVREARGSDGASAAGA